MPDDESKWDEHYAEGQAMRAALDAGLDARQAAKLAAMHGEFHNPHCLRMTAAKLRDVASIHIEEQVRHLAQTDGTVRQYVRRPPPPPPTAEQIRAQTTHGFPALPRLQHNFPREMKIEDWYQFYAAQHAAGGSPGIGLKPITTK